MLWLQEDLVDLHTHSNCSDGSMTPTELVRHAAAIGLKAIALTDHDTVDGLAEAMEAGSRYMVEVVPGIELSTKTDTQVHILGYYIDPGCPALLEAFEELREERRRTHERYLKRLNDYGFAITEEDVAKIVTHGGIGRAHYARIMMNKGYVSSVSEAFDRYLGVGMPCYVERQVMHPKKAIKLIHEAGGVAFFAHPYQTKLSDKALYDLMRSLKMAGLDGLEGYYSEYTEEMVAQYAYLAKELRLGRSGGSDFHAAMKPHIKLGIGKGNLRVPYSVLQQIRRITRRRNPSCTFSPTYEELRLAIEKEFEELCAENWEMSSEDWEF